MASEWIAGKIERQGKEIPFHWYLQGGRIIVNCAGETKRSDRSKSGANATLAAIIAGELYNKSLLGTARSTS